MSDKLDPDSLDKIELEPEHLGSTFASGALALSGFAWIPAALFAAIKDQFDPVVRQGRIRLVLESVDGNFTKLQSQLSAERTELREVQERFQGKQFQEAVTTACEEAARTTNMEKVERLAQVAANLLTPTQWSPADEDVVSLIRDLAQLSDRDVDVLSKLSLAFGGLMLSYPKLPDNVFTDNNKGLEDILHKEADPDDFYSACGRLIGFGLAIDVTWPMNRTQPHTRCIRPTRRGAALLGYLRKFAS